LAANDPAMAITRPFRPQRFEIRRRRHVPRHWIVALAALVFMAGYYAFSRGSVALPHVDLKREKFAKCGYITRDNCVIDGDTFLIAGEKIRIADIDAPETGGAQCASEAELGARATARLRELLNQGPFELQSYRSRDADQYGRKLRVVMRDGMSIGEILISEGLARRWGGRRRPWCT
jgi:micrococcal nuclease